MNITGGEAQMTVTKAPVLKGSAGEMRASVTIKRKSGEVRNVELILKPETNDVGHTLAGGDNGRDERGYGTD